MQNCSVALRPMVPFNPHQLSLLREALRNNTLPVLFVRNYLAKRMGVSRKEVTNWFIHQIKKGRELRSKVEVIPGEF